MDGAVQAGERAAHEVACLLHKERVITDPILPLQPEPENKKVISLLCVQTVVIDSLNCRLDCCLCDRSRT